MERNDRPMRFWHAQDLRSAWLHGRIYSQQGPVQKKCGVLQLERQTLFFLEKKLATFFSHYRPCVSCQFSKKTGDLFCSSLSLLFISLVHSGGVAHYFRHAKICRSFCGGPFLWGPLFGRTCWRCLNPPLHDCSTGGRTIRNWPFTFMLTIGYVLSVLLDSHDYTPIEPILL